MWRGRPCGTFTHCPLTARSRSINRQFCRRWSEPPSMRDVASALKRTDPEKASLKRTRRNSPVHRASIAWRSWVHPWPTNVPQCSLDQTDFLHLRLTSPPPPRSVLEQGASVCQSNRGGVRGFRHTQPAQACRREHQPAHRGR